MRFLFDKFKRHSQIKQTNPSPITEKPEKVTNVNGSKTPENPKTCENTQKLDDKSKETIKPESKLEEKPAITCISKYSNNELESEFMVIKDYSSFS